MKQHPLENFTPRVMSVEEASNVAQVWELSPECAKLQEKNKKLKEAISQKSASYSNRV